MTVFAVNGDAGFRAVARHQLAGAWQVPAELVRFAVAWGAESVNLTWKGRRLELRAAGASVSISILEAAALAMGTGGGLNRLQSLGELEDREATTLAWAAGTDPRLLEIEVHGPAGGALLFQKKNNRPRITSLSAGEERSVRLLLVGPRIGRDRAQEWLQTACRFSQVPVLLNGCDLRKGLDSGSFRARIASPLPAEVALGVPHESPRLWLLRHGIVETRATVPGWPPFEAAIEMAGEVGGWASPADLRRTLSGSLPALVLRVVDLMLRVVPRLEEVGESGRSSVVHALLIAAKSEIRRREINEASIFELFEAGERRRVSLEDLRRWSGRLPRTVDLSIQVGDLREPVLRLGLGERELLADLLGRSLEIAVTVQATKENRFRGWLSSLADFGIRLVSPPPLAEAFMSPSEIALARALESCLDADGSMVEVRFTKGGGVIRFSRRTLRLPRLNTDVQNCGRALQEDPASLYLIALALAPENWEVSPSVRMRC
ncbi:MAG: hypothetical protein K8R59_02250 [Thermoanaerobaculales bacterium]|nr:hypothetical protein [Thermoanaerobaculales bacterium]